MILQSIYFHNFAYKVAEVGPDPDYRSRLREDPAFFFRNRDPDRESKIWENRTRIRSHF